jgi:competence protein ComEC
MSRPPANLNDCSVVAMASIESSRVLLTGDIEQDAQDVLLKDHPSMICDVIKIPHQGAANAATAGLIDAARPAIATISVGRLNEFGHPSRKCLDLLASRGVTVQRTDLQGDIVISLGNGRIGLQTSGR